ncbi:MAG TPA: PilZ domain-containing protein [Sphingomicrobium sp.]|nr:PilZ domain-containing protein [Sphingomicrobium sp.]
MQDQPVETTVYSLAATTPTQPDRRGGDRYLSLLRVGAIEVADRRELCLIRNISAGGMMIRAYSAIEIGASLTVELKQGDPVSGIVKWTEDGLTGVTFDTPIDVILLLAPPGDGPRPRLPRIEVDCTAWVRQDGDVIRTRVLNISQGGVCVQARTALTVGADVVVTLPGLTPVAGVVKWNDDGAYGLGFNRALVLSDLVEWLQEQQQEEQRRVMATATAVA